VSNDHFRFKQFSVFQSSCAMKVGFDACLLGSWAPSPPNATRMLDIGTGTGVLALMLAQRFPSATLTAIDIDHDSVRQASENVAISAFRSRVSVLHSAFELFARSAIRSGTLFHAIVSNPPYFQPSTQSLLASDPQRAVARHDSDGLLRQIFTLTPRLLTPDGILSLILPAELQSHALSLANSLNLISCVSVFTSPRRQSPKRILLSFSLAPSAPSFSRLDVRNADGSFSSDYSRLLSPFYLHLS